MFFTLYTCKKYPEDKFISFSTSKYRLEGEWQLEKIEINDENVGFKYDDSLAPLTFKDFKFWFKFGYCLNTPASGSRETVDLLMINKFSKKEADAINDAEVSGLAFGLSPKERDLGITLSLKKIFPINDPVAFKILSNLLLVNLLVDRQGWEVRALHNKQLIIERTKNNIKSRINFKKIRNK